MAPLVSALHISACCAKSVCAKAASLAVQKFRTRAVAFQPLAVAACGDLLQPFRKLVPFHVSIYCKQSRVSTTACVTHGQLLWLCLATMSAASNTVKYHYFLCLSLRNIVHIDVSSGIFCACAPSSSSSSLCSQVLFFSCDRSPLCR